MLSRPRLLALVLMGMGLVCVAHAQQTEPLTAAVGDLVAQGVSTSEAAVLTEQLRVALARSPRLRLMERGQLEEVLQEQGFQQSGCTSNECAVEVGQLLGVKVMVLGTVGVAGSYTILSVRAIDVATGSVTANESVQTKDGINGLLESGINEVAGQLSARLSGSTNAASSTEPAPKKRRPMRAVLIGGGAAVLVGAGVLVAVLLASDDDPEPSGMNTRIELP